MKYGLGVDVGGTKIATVIIDQHGKIISRVEVPSAPFDKEKMFEQVVNSIDNVLVKSKLDISMIEGMGVGVPGKVDRDNGIAIYQNNLPWQKFPIVDRLKERFPIQNIVIDNDVYMAAYAEWMVSDANDKSTFVYVTVSTGISCSTIHNGTFIRGNGFAGELGLFPVLSNSSLKGIHNLEKIASGPAIQKQAERFMNQINITTRDFFMGFEKDDENAQKLMSEVTESLAHGIYSIVCLLDPQKIIFGGGVIYNHPFLLDLVKEKLDYYVISEQKHTLNRMQTSKLKENAGVVGAGLLGLKYLDNYFKEVKMK